MPENGGTDKKPENGVTHNKSDVAGNKKTLSGIRPRIEVIYWIAGIGTLITTIMFHYEKEIAPPPLAPFWQDVRTHEVVQITRKGNDIFQKGVKGYSNNGVPYERNFECKTSQNGSQWSGDCSYLYKTEDGRQCWVKTEEVLTSVNPNIIEGKSQDIDSPKNGRECPVPAAGWNTYSLQPKP